MEDTKQYHLPTYKYLGPGTRVMTNLHNKVMPKNKLDAAALIHDVEYLNGNQQEADARMVRNVSKPLKPLVWSAFKAKDLIGYKPRVNTKLYDKALKKINTDPDYVKALSGLEKPKYRRVQKAQGWRRR